MTIQPYRHQAQYYETDQMGIVHHSNYIRWMEEARIDFMKQAGLSYRKMEALEIIIPVLEVQCVYHSMVRFDDTVEIHTRLTAYNGVKLSLSYEMRNPASGAVCTSGSSKHCFLTPEHRPLSLKRSFPDLHEKFAELLKI